MKNCCAACGSDKLIAHKENSPVTYKGKQGSIVTLYSSCENCGSETVTDEQSKLNQRLFMEFKKVSEGFLTGAQMRQLRERLCITQSEASLIFGGGPNAFTKYENDDVMQSSSMDKLVRISVDFPDVFEKLKEQSGVSSYKGRVEILAFSQRVESIEPFSYSDSIGYVRRHLNNHFIGLTESTH